MKGVGVYIFLCIYLNIYIYTYVYPLVNHDTKKKLSNIYLAVVSIFFSLHPYLGKWYSLTNIFQVKTKH